MRTMKGTLIHVTERELRLLITAVETVKVIAENSNDFDEQASHRDSWQQLYQDMVELGKDLNRTLAEKPF